MQSNVVVQNNKKYRPNVGIIVLSHNYPDVCEFFLAKRNDLKDIWQFPQGGIDLGETPKVALLRELSEEIGTNKVEIIAEYPDWIAYDFPPAIAKKMYPFDGQIQKYFLVKLQKDSVVNIQTEEPEFSDYMFVDYHTLLHKIIGFKKDVYLQVLEYFKKEGYI